MKKDFVSLIACLLFLSPGAKAASSIASVDVQSGAVVFALQTPQSSPTPSCVTPEHIGKWSVALADENGKAIYAILMTALATKASIQVEPGQDCAVIAGIERAAGVLLVKEITSSQSQATMKVLKTVAYGSSYYRYYSGQTTAYCNIATSLISKEGSTYMYGVGSNQAVCGCRGGSTLVFDDFHEDNGRRNTYQKCVIEVEIPVANQP